MQLNIMPIQKWKLGDQNQVLISLKIEELERENWDLYFE